jgi:hypothetical protein
MRKPDQSSNAGHPKGGKPGRRFLSPISFGRTKEMGQLPVCHRRF